MTDTEKSLYINALFVQILLEIKRNLKFSTSLKSRDRGSLVYKALNYINENYRSHIDLESIAQSLSISSSTLSHQFKKELNISVHKYILRKRMIYAHRLLRMGLSSAEACEQSGYSDYAAFYRAYKSFYGITPAETRTKGSL